MSHSKNLQVGIIGAGWWATFAHIPAVQEHPRAEVLAVQCRTQDKADKVARDYGHFIYQGMSNESVHPLLPHAPHFHARGGTKGQLQSTVFSLPKWHIVPH